MIVDKTQQGEAQKNIVDIVFRFFGFEIIKLRFMDKEFTVNEVGVTDSNGNTQGKKTFNIWHAKRCDIWSVSLVMFPFVMYIINFYLFLKLSQLYCILFHFHCIILIFIS